MSRLREWLNTWPPFAFAILAVIGLMILAFKLNSADASERTESTTKGYVDSTPIRTKTVTQADGSKTTRGYLGNQKIRTKTVITAAGTQTKGYIGSERIRVKTKKD